MRKILAVTFTLFLSACAPEEPAGPVSDWRLSIQLPDVELPVLLHLAPDGSEAWLSNGMEKALIPEVRRVADGGLELLAFLDVEAAADADNGARINRAATGRASIRRRGRYRLSSS